MCWPGRTTTITAHLAEMFRVMERYTPTLLPASIDEGFLDLTAMERYVWRGRGAVGYVNRLRAEIESAVGVPVSAGLGASMWAAKLATSAAKPGSARFRSGRAGVLADRPVDELAGCGGRRMRALAALGAHTFGDVARMPSILLRKRFGIWGQQLWLFARGEWTEPVVVEEKDRTTISSNTTLPVDEPDYDAGLIFLLSEAARLTGQLRREGLQTRESFVSIRFSDFERTGCQHRFRHPQFRNSVISGVIEQLYWKSMRGAHKPIRQICLGFSSLERLDTQPMLWGSTDAGRWGAIDDALRVIEQRFGENTVMTGAQFALKNRTTFLRYPRPSALWPARSQPGRPRPDRSQKGAALPKTWSGGRRRLPGQALVWLAPACGSVKFPGRSRHENETAETACASLPPLPRRASQAKPRPTTARSAFCSSATRASITTPTCTTRCSPARLAGMRSISTTSPRSRRRWATPTISASLTPCCSTPATAGSSRTSGRT